jgi:transcriptional regulator with XRE-family HTH domain
MRTAAALTQEKLAERAQVSHRYLQALEAGQKQPSINVVARLRAALDCDWDALLFGM